MDSFEWNKVAAAILVSLLLFMGVTLLSEAVFEGEEEVILGTNEASSDTPATPVDEGPNFQVLLVREAPNPDPRSFRKCQACHNANEGGAHQIGPNLWNVVNAPLAAKPGYAYSSAMAGKGGSWTYDALNTFLTRPSADVPGTKMSFAGIRTKEERAQVIAYLRSMAANPAPLPEVPADDAGEGEADEAATSDTEPAS